MLLVIGEGAEPGLELALLRWAVVISVGRRNEPARRDELDDL